VGACICDVALNNVKYDNPQDFLSLVAIKHHIFYEYSVCEPVVSRIHGFGPLLLDFSIG
jgi:hypothetical protein